MQNSQQFKVHKEQKVEWLSQQMSSLSTIQSRAEAELRERQEQNLNLELRKHRRRALLDRHNLEQDFLREVRFIKIPDFLSSYTNVPTTMEVINNVTREKANRTYKSRVLSANRR